MKWLRSLAALRSDLPRLLPMLRSAAVPLWAKAFAVLAALFIVSPLNLLGDIPILGFLDDGILLAFVVHRFVAFAQQRMADAGTRPA